MTRFSEGKAGVEEVDGRRRENLLIFGRGVFRGAAAILKNRFPFLLRSRPSPAKVVNGERISVWVSWIENKVKITPSTVNAELNGRAVINELGFDLELVDPRISAATWWIVFPALSACPAAPIFPGKKKTFQSRRLYPVSFPAECLSCRPPPLPRTLPGRAGDVVREEKSRDRQRTFPLVMTQARPERSERRGFSHRPLDHVAGDDAGTEIIVRNSARDRVYTSPTITDCPF